MTDFPQCQYMFHAFTMSTVPLIWKRCGYTKDQQILLSVIEKAKFLNHGVLKVSDGKEDVFLLQRYYVQITAVM